MPKKKESIVDELLMTESVPLAKREEPLRTLETFQVLDGFSKIWYYRLQHEVRPHINKRLTLTEWRKLLEKVKSEEN